MFDHEPIDQLSSGDIRMINIACENFENLWASRSKNTMHPDLIEMLDQSQLKSAEQPEIARKALCLALVHSDREARANRELAFSRSEYEAFLPGNLKSVLDLVDWDSHPLGYPLKICLLYTSPSPRDRG